MLEPKEIADRLDTLEGQRTAWDSHWQEIADYMRPERKSWLEQYTNGGEKRMSKVFDATPIMALQNFASGLYGMVTNPANRWLQLATPDQDLNEYHSVKIWLDTVSTLVLRSFGEATSLFYSTIAEHYVDYAAFGTGVYYTQEIPGRQRIQDVARPLSECYLDEDEWGEVNQLYRRFEATAEHAVKRFGNRVSDRIKRSAEKRPKEKFRFVHYTGPNPDYQPGRIGPRGMPFVSQYIERDKPHTVKAGGYEEFPWSTPRYAVDSGELYGRGPGMIALPDVKMLNAMERTILEAAQRTANPALLAPDEGAIVAIRTRPGQITYGGLTRQGRRLVEPLITGMKPDLSLELSQQRRDSIKDAFMFSLMQLAGRTGMTATEIMERQEEKLRLLGPSLGRLQTEGLTRIVARHYAILNRAGQLPPPPREMQGQRLDVHYVSPMAQAQRSQQGTGILRVVQALQALIAIDPSAADGFDADQALRDLQEAFSAPPAIVFGPDELQKRREQKQRLQQLAQAVQMADVAGGAAQKFGQAAQTMGAGMNAANAA